MPSICKQGWAHEVILNTNKRSNNHSLLDQKMICIEDQVKLNPTKYFNDDALLARLTKNSNRPHAKRPRDRENSSS